MYVLLIIVILDFTIYFIILQCGLSVWYLSLRLYTSLVVFYFQSLLFYAKQSEIRRYLCSNIVLGVVFYGFAAINALWKRPLKIKFEVSTKYSNQSISQWKYGQIESMKINLQLSKYRLYISLSISCIIIALK